MAKAVALDTHATRPAPAPQTALRPGGESATTASIKSNRTESTIRNCEIWYVSRQAHAFEGTSAKATSATSAAIHLPVLGLRAVLVLIAV